MAAKKGTKKGAKKRGAKKGGKRTTKKGGKKGTKKSGKRGSKKSGAKAHECCIPTRVLKNKRAKLDKLIAKREKQGIP